MNNKNINTASFSANQISALIESIYSAALEPKDWSLLINVINQFNTQTPKEGNQKNTDEVIKQLEQLLYPHIKQANLITEKKPCKNK